jgi:hypothetical protein
MFGQLALLVIAALLGPVLAAGRRPLVPVLVGELAAGASDEDRAPARQDNEPVTTLVIVAIG